MLESFKCAYKMGNKANTNEKLNSLPSVEGNCRVTVTRISRTQYPCDDLASQHMAYIKENPPILYSR